MAAEAQDGRLAAQSCAREQEGNGAGEAPRGPARPVLLGAGALALSGLGAGPSSGQEAAQSGNSIKDLLSGDIAPVHDPCIMAQDGTYYVFCTTGSRIENGSIGNISVPWCPEESACMRRCFILP
jgi:hypothetical protein